jgi:hypothetical protein
MAAHENPALSPCQIEAPARARMSHRFFLSDPVRALCGAVVPDSKSVPGMADCVVCMEAIASARSTSALAPARGAVGAPS